ncbi:MAG: putative DNA binding domain-containing protein [Acidobacteria bacterium]|nr:putative DNA binding domain-containing protein [Acidobacteriota bacterium]MCW5968597.1 putative DNA binding domain-containing protein [Blastocatellales bacterium]
MHLAELLTRAEGKDLEFKRDLSSHDGVLQTIVAFANTSGGTVLIGVEDKTRRVRGVKDVLAEEERLASLISDQIEPRLAPEIEILPWRRTNILAVCIYPSSSRPHYYRKLGFPEGVFVRIGSTNRRADPALVEEMRRFTRRESFDEQPVPGLNSEAIDFRVASELFAERRKLKRSDLRALSLLTKHQGKEVPTVGGLLLFGREPDRGALFPDAWIQAGRFAGTDRRRILDTVEIRSLPVEAIEKAIEFVRKYLAREVIIEAARHRERWTLPMAALREAVVNAVVHADYSQRGAPIRLALFDDRLEVENPGLLPFGLTIEDLWQGISRLRNRVLGRVFQELGLIEQWGSGIQRMAAACSESGLPAPRLEEIGMRFRVTLSLIAQRKPELDERDMKILGILSVENGCSTRQIADHLGLSTRATRSRLLALVDRGVIAEIGSSPNDPRRIYRRTPVTS